MNLPTDRALLLSSIAQYVYKNENGVITNSRPLFGKDIGLLKWAPTEGGSPLDMWMNDNVIGYFMAEYDLRDKANQRSSSRKPTKFLDSFFLERLLLGGRYSHGNVRRWTKRQSLSKFDKVFIPVNIRNAHWALIVVRMSAKTVSYYDSMNGDGSAYFDAILRYLEDESKGDPALDKEPWTFDRLKWKCLNVKTPQQTNGYDCGIFVIQLADLLSLDIPLLFGQADMAIVRRRLLSSIFDRVSDPAGDRFCNVAGVLDIDEDV